MEELIITEDISDTIITDQSENDLNERIYDLITSTIIEQPETEPNEPPKKKRKRKHKHKSNDDIL